MADGNKTIRNVDIAREAGVANSVVSSYFSGNYYDKRKGAVVGISKETKERIQRACRTLGYRPTDPSLFMEMYPDEADVIFLLNKQSGTFANKFFSRILDGLVEEAQTDQVNLCLGWFETDIDYCVQSDKVPRVVKNNPTGKYVLAGQPNYSLILYLLQSGARVAYIARHIQISGMISIVPDYCNAAKMALNYLKDCGHEGIAVVAERHFHENDYHTGQLVKGCAEILSGFSYGDVLPCGYNDGQLELLRRIFKADDAPTGVFCFDGATAIGLMRNLTPMGVRIPEDLSIIICCNDEEYGLEMNPYMTGVELPMYRIGQSAFRAVTRFAVEGPPSSAELEVWPVKLFELDSVGKV